MTVDRERRQKILTDEDLAAIIEAIAVHNKCNMGLTADEVTTLKRLLKAFNGAATLVGGLIITAIVGGIIAIFTRGFWASLLYGFKDVHK